MNGYAPVHLKAHDIYILLESLLTVGSSVIQAVTRVGCHLSIHLQVMLQLG